MKRMVLRTLVGGGILVAAAVLSSSGNAGEPRGAEVDQARIEALSTSGEQDLGAPGEDLLPGGKGQCTAMELDGTVILVEDAPPKSMSHDYVACGKTLKEKLRPVLCARGKGIQKFLYKISDNKPSKSSLRCK